MNGGLPFDVPTSKKIESDRYQAEIETEDEINWMDRLQTVEEEESPEKPSELNVKETISEQNSPSIDPESEEEEENELHKVHML